ncbi:MAG: arginine repressor [Sphingomicrobium sp.]|nr:arginine repressor [Sphingomonadales bacterium]
MSGKDQRRRLIVDWLREQRVASQEELVARLELAGIAATQATVSRDLDEIGAVRMKRDGAVRYVLAEEVDAGAAARRLDRLLAEWVTAIVSAGPLLVLRTPPGSANLVASAIDVADLPEVAGTIAGDDTIFIALADGVAPGAFAAVLRERRAAG